MRHKSEERIVQLPHFKTSSQSFPQHTPISLINPCSRSWCSAGRCHTSQRGGRSGVARSLVTPESACRALAHV